METWIEVSSLPKPGTNVWDRFRARISTGTVFSSVKNPDVPRVGVVPGGPRRSVR